MENKKFTKEMVDKYADKLLIGLTEEENKMVLEEFEEIDKNISLINEIPGLNEVELMSWCLDRTISELRDDEASESIPVDILLTNCDVKSGDSVEVPRVVEA